MDVEFELVYWVFLAQELVVKISFEKLTLFFVLEVSLFLEKINQAKDVE